MAMWEDSVDVIDKLGTNNAKLRAEIERLKALLRECRPHVYRSLRTGHDDDDCKTLVRKLAEALR